MRNIIRCLSILLFAGSIAIAQTNESDVHQTGNENDALVTQTGAQNDNFTTQTGNKNDAVTDVVGDVNFTKTYQYNGDLNEAKQTVRGNVNDLYLLQRGNSNYGSQSLSISTGYPPGMPSVDNFLHIDQQGDHNTGVQNIQGDRNKDVRILQIGNSNLSRQLGWGSDYNNVRQTIRGVQNNQATNFTSHFNRTDFAEWTPANYEEWPLAGGSELWYNQVFTGDHNDLNISISGNNNMTAQLVEGDRNDADIVLRASSNGNNALQSVEGDRNTTLIDIYGDNNGAFNEMVGDINESSIYMNGNYNEGCVSQFGDSHFSLLDVDGNLNVAKIKQDGFNHDSKVTQNGNGNLSEVTQMNGGI